MVTWRAIWRFLVIGATTASLLVAPVIRWPAVGAPAVVAPPTPAAEVAVTPIVPGDSPRG